MMMKGKTECFKIMSCVAKRKLEGVMVHDILSDAFLMMNLHAFHAKHDERAFDEFEEFRGVKSHVIKRYGYIPATDGATIEDTSVLNFHHKYNRDNMTTETKKKVIAYLLEYAVEWESETIEVLSEKYRELMNHGNVVDALYVEEMIEGTSKELEEFVAVHIKYKDMNYDMVQIASEQTED